MSKARISLAAFAGAFALLGAPKTPRPPQQILGAKRIFILNAGGEEDAVKSLPGKMFHGGTDRAYNQFFASMKSWGRFQLVQTPAGADLIFEIKYIDQPTTETIKTKVHSERYEQTHADASGVVTEVRHPRVSLSIRDPKSHSDIVTLQEDIDLAALESNREKNFNRSISALANHLRKLVGEKAVKISVLSEASAAPVPPQIGAAARIFVHNAGTQKVRGGTGDPDQAYTDFCANLKSWGRYTLVPTAADADLIFELSFGDGQLRLTIVDPKTMIGLWAFNEDADLVLLKGSSAKYYQRALAALSANLARIAGQPESATSVSPAH